MHELQKVVAANPDWDRNRLDRHMQQRPLQESGVVWLDSFQRGADGGFNATTKPLDAAAAAAYGWAQAPRMTMCSASRRRSTAARCLQAVMRCGPSAASVVPWIPA